MLVFPLIGFGNAPFGIFGGKQLFEAFVLNLFGDVQEKLHHQIAIVRKLPLEIVDALNPAAVFLAAKRIVHAILHRFAIPAGIKKHELPCLGDFLEIPPQKGMAAFFFRGRIDGKHIEGTRVDVENDVADQAALARGPPALDENHNRQLGLLDLLLLNGQPGFQRGDFRLNRRFFALDGNARQFFKHALTPAL